MRRIINEPSFSIFDTLLGASALPRYNSLENVYKPSLLFKNQNITYKWKTTLTYDVCDITDLQLTDVEMGYMFKYEI